jgi:hypothetical protein
VDFEVFAVFAAVDLAVVDFVAEIVFFMVNPSNYLELEFLITTSSNDFVHFPKLSMVATGSTTSIFMLGYGLVTLVLAG